MTYLFLIVLVVVPAALCTACVMWAASIRLGQAVRELQDQKRHNERWRTIRVEPEEKR